MKRNHPSIVIPETRQGAAAVRDQVRSTTRPARDCLLRHRRRPAPDVGGAVLLDTTSRTASSPPAASARWASRCRRRWARRSAAPEATRLVDLRRRRLPDDAAGAGDDRRVRTADQVRDHQQRLPGHGAPVAGAVLQEQPRRRAHVPARLREAGRGVRHPRPARQRQGSRSMPAIERGAGPPGPVAHRLPGEVRREHATRWCRRARRCGETIDQPTLGAGQGAGGEWPDETARCRSRPHTDHRAGRGQAGRAQPHRLQVAAARLQHRVAGRRPLGDAGPVAHDVRRRRATRTSSRW